MRCLIDWGNLFSYLLLRRFERKLKKTPHKKRASPRKNGTGEKTGTGGVLQEHFLIRKSSVFHKAGV
jgi:hypothetical protein